MTERAICLTIDGQEIRCSDGCTIYEAASGAGIHIPTFCHHEKLVPVGACRMCLVEIEGARGLQTACTTPVRDGMVVKVHTSPEAVKARKANIEFLLIDKHTILSDFKRELRLNDVYYYLNTWL